MQVQKAERRLLGLNKRESELLSALERLKTASMQELADELKLPRTSLYWPLDQLYKRNLVVYEKVGKRKRWYSRMGELPLRKKLGSLETVAGDVRVVEGVEQIKELYRLSLDLHPTERVLILEGTVAATSIARKGGIDFLTEYHERAYKNKIIVESIFGEKLYENVLRMIVDPKIVRSLSRLNTWIAHIVPEEWMNVDAAVVLFRETAIIADWTKTHAVLVNNPEIVRLLRNFCEVFQLTGRKVDIVSEIRSAVAKSSSNAPAGEDAQPRE